MSRLTVPGAEIYYEVSGRGPALVFAHGLDGNHMSWWQQGPFFKDRWTCITVRARLVAAMTTQSDRVAALAPPTLWLFGTDSYLGPETEVFNQLVAEFLDAA